MGMDSYKAEITLGEDTLDASNDPLTYPKSDTDGIFGGALEFDGVGDYLDFGDQSMHCFANPDRCNEGLENNS